MTARVLVWDLPTRLFHWLFAGSFVAAFTIGQVVDDDAAAFKLHMLLGGVMAFMVLLRVVWGFVGSRHARFSAFVFGPRAVFDYLSRALRGQETHHAGHNPGSSVAIFLMLALALGLAGTGALMSSGGELVEEAHEVLAYLMVATVAAHVAGVVWHTVRHRENLARSMIDGCKVAPADQAVPSTHPLVAAVFLGLVGLWTVGLVQGYDPATQRVTLPLVGASITLGEEEHEEHERRGRRDHDEG